MGKKNPRSSSKKGKSKKSKSKKNRAKNTESNLANEKQGQTKSSFEDIAEIFLGSDVEANPYSNANSNANISDTGKTNADESTAETTSTDTNTNTNANNDVNDVIKAQQKEILNNLKNLNDAIAAMTLTRDNIASLRIEILSNIYFTRELRPLIDAVNLIAFASSNMSNIANNININSFGDKKEIKEAFKLCYKMNDEIDDMLGTLSRRIKLYTAQLDNMDKNCPPFSFDEDS